MPRRRKGPTAGDYRQHMEKKEKAMLYRSPEYYRMQERAAKLRGRILRSSHYLTLDILERNVKTSNILTPSERDELLRLIEERRKRPRR